MPILPQQEISEKKLHIACCVKRVCDCLKAKVKKGITFFLVPRKEIWMQRISQTELRLRRKE
jgi:hypothetical protein